MKRIALLFLLGSGCMLAQAQNVGIGTTTPVAKLHIKGNQDSSQLIIDANATQSNAHPLIRLRKADGSDLLQIHSDDTSNIFIGIGAGHANIAPEGSHNVFLGWHAGYANKTGFSNVGIGQQVLEHNTSGQLNIAIGDAALNSNTTGFSNTGVGMNALALNTTGNSNTSLGAYALTQSTTGSSNTAMGGSALQNNTDGDFNTATGMSALQSNLSGHANTSTGYQALYNTDFGSYNTAVGALALYENQGALGSYNTAVGYQALQFTTTAEYNTAIGYNAGRGQDNGYNNVFIGANTDVDGPGYYNVIAIGQGTVCTGSSEVTMGNPATGIYRAYSSWSNISDGRFKRNIRENVPGLDFITKLRPVTYNLNATDLDAFLHKGTKEVAAANTKNGDGGTRSRESYDKALKEKEGQVITGFVAQDVEAAAKSLGFTFSGVQAPAHAGDVYGLSYAEFVVPLVKAVQEQQQMIVNMKKEIEELKAQLKSIKK